MSMNRAMWAAMLAKMVAPLDAERGAKAIAGMVSMLQYPDAAFSMQSAQEVAATGRVMEGEVRGSGGSLVKSAAFGPLTRVPTYGEIDVALGRWWRNQRDMAAVRAAPVARERLAAEGYRAPSSPCAPTPEAIAAAEALRASFVADRSWNDPNHVAHVTNVQPRHLSDGHLLATYEKAAAEGLPGAATRLAMIRSRLNPVSDRKHA